MTIIIVRRPTIMDHKLGKPYIYRDCYRRFISTNQIAGELTMDSLSSALPHEEMLPKTIVSYDSLANLFPSAFLGTKSGKGNLLLTAPPPSLIHLHCPKEGMIDFLP